MNNKHHMKRLLLILLLVLIPCTVLSQTTRRIKFQVNWKDITATSDPYDSTRIDVYTTLDTIPVLTKFARINPDTLSLPAPQDTVTYR